MPKTEQRDKRMQRNASSIVKRALTFTRAKLDVALYSIQNFNLGQNTAATCPVIKPRDCKKSTKVDQTLWLVASHSDSTAKVNSMLPSCVQTKAGFNTSVRAALG